MRGAIMVRIGRSAVAAVLTAALAAGAAAAAPTAGAGPAPAPAPGVTRWSPALTAGDAVGVQVTDGVVALTPERARSADEDRSPDGHGDTDAPGLLTLPARRLAAPVDRIEATVDLTAPDPDSTVSVDIRGLQQSGTWTEWQSAETASDLAGTATDRSLNVVLPAPSTQVQARLVLAPADAGAAEPEVAGLTLTAYPAAPSVRTQAPRVPLRSRIFATREGLVGHTTANGHKIAARDLFVALPSRRALSPRNTSDYAVKACAPNGRCAFAPVWDVGPWNTRDDYWNPAGRRQSWRDLPQGMPEAQAAKAKGYNKGKDQFGRKVRNQAGIDLSDGLFRDALGLKDNAWVTVDFLWTGDSPLAAVRVDGRVDLRGAPDPKARIVGLVADRAAVPVQCVTGTWLRIGSGQFLPATSVPRAQWPPRLPTCSGG
jgi:hypothetical protein